MKGAKLTTLGAKVRDKRGDSKLRDTAAQIGISAPTLMRIEAGRIPDVVTFGRICQWLEISPESFLDYTPVSEGRIAESTQVSTHLKAPRLMKPETLGALSRMILLASSAQNITQRFDDDIS